MKKFLKIAFLLNMALIWNACEEDIPGIKPLPILEPTTLDADARDWQPVLKINYGSAISIPVPSSVSSLEYLEELGELEVLTGERTAAQKTAAEFWAGGGVVRWNQIARDFVIRYNVAPNVTSPPTQPNPNKPFTNPPVAARVYAMLSVVQHDALIAAWKFKYQYNRPAPAKTNPEINLLVPETDLPSYPSEQAVIAQASFRILEFLFPAKSDSLDLLAKAQQHMNSAMWAGISTQSDLDAGKIIGDYVAAQVINRAKTDRMSQAADPNKTFMAYFGLEEHPNPWVSIELPSRPPMLPLYGKVKPWYDSVSVFNALPPPPPAFGSDIFMKDLKEVKSICDNRSREQWRIAELWADGTGTPTPPGHWNIIAEGLVTQSKLSEVRTARTFSLMNRAIMDAGILCWYAKYKWFIPRPSQMDPGIKTSTGIPNFPSYTSGHSSFSGAAAVILGHLFPLERTQLLQWAEEAAMSRLYGGIHYRFDNDAGRDAGFTIGQVAIDNALADGAD